MWSAFTRVCLCGLTWSFCTLSGLIWQPSAILFWCTISLFPYFFILKYSSHLVPWCFRTGAQVAVGIHVEPRQQYRMNNSAPVFYSYFSPPHNFVEHVHSVFHPHMSAFAVTKQWTLFEFIPPAGS